MEFLPTVSLDATPGELEVWNHLKEALRGEEGIACLRYPIFPKGATWRYEPDILLLHRQLGLVVIEVKDCHAGNVEALDGHVWRMTDWYAPQASPGEQAYKQLFALKSYFDRYANLRDRLRAHALVALPRVPLTDWIAKGFADLPHNPKIIHQDQLTPARLRRRLYELTRGNTQPIMSDEEWALACQVLGLRPALERHGVPPGASGDPLVDLIRHSEAAIPALDIEQLKIGLEIPPGPQRIRGIAGSGKTLLLAMKAARMHLSHPDWDIAVTFNTKSLYQGVEAHISRFCRHFGDEEPNWDKLRVLHAWGGEKAGPGLYSVLAEAAGHPARSLGWAKQQNWKGAPADHLAAVCRDLIDSGRLSPVFDAILIDEGQDFEPAFYQMALGGLRAPQRLIWAYDEAQSLDSLRIPNAEKLFGRDERGQLKVDLVGYYPGGIQKSRVMRKCYRTPAQILMPAHAFGMGLLRAAGPVQMISTQQGWQDIGYHVEGSFDGHARPIVLSRPAEHCPHPLDREQTLRVLSPRTFDTREEEMNHCADEVASLAGHGVPLDDVMIIFPAHFKDTEDTRYDMSRLAGKLASRGLAVHLAEDGNDDRFRRAGAVTLTRIHRAKGNEAPFVFVVGVDRLDATEHQVDSRNQLFVALTRARGYCRISGATPLAARLFDELNAVLAAGERLTFLTPGPLTPVQDRTDHTAQEERQGPAVVVPFINHLPLYDIPVAAGPWFGSRVPELEPEHWVEATEYGPLSPQYYAVRISGASMEPRIPDGSIAIFQQATVASEGKIVLAGLADEHDHDAASWVVKRYVVHHHPHGHVEYRLKSDNPAHPDIPIGPAEAARLRIQGVLKWVLPPGV